MCKRFIVLLAVFGLLSWTGSSSFAQTTCDDAIEIDGNDIIEGSTLGGPPATEDNEFNCGPWDSPGAWYMLLGNGGATTVTTCGGNLSTYDTALSVFSGECGDFVCMGANDDACATFRTDSTVSWDSEEDETYYILVHGWATSKGNFTLTSTQLEPGVASFSPNGFIQAKGWNMLFPVLNPGGCGGGGVGMMSENWVQPYDLNEEDPRAGDEWDIDFGLTPGNGFDNGGLSDGPIWITTDFVLDNLGLGLTGGDLIDFQQMCVELTNANVGGPIPNDNVMSISTTYVENTTDEAIRVYVCSASDDSVRVDVNNHTATIISACRGSGLVCQDINCSELAPGINKITAYVWEGGGGWRMAIGLRDEAMRNITDGTEGIVFHGSDEGGDLESQEVAERPDCTLEGVNPFGWLRTEAWNMLFLDQDGGAAVAPDRMIGNWVTPYEMAEENPRPGEEWDIEFFDAESTGWGGFVFNKLPTWFSVASMDDEGILLSVGDLVDFNAIASQVGFGTNDNIMSISTTYVENSTDAPMRVEVCTASDDSIRVDVNDYTVTLVSASRGSALNCQEIRCADLAPGVNKITAYVWEGGGGWNMRIALRDEDGNPLTDASEGIIFHGTGEDDELEGQFIDAPPADCVEAGPPPPDEVCDNGIDDDGDGDSDCDDADCSDAQSCQPPPDEICDNGLDDDEDGDADCNDADCSEAANCQPSGPLFVRGDTNSDGSINLTDGVIPLLYLFSGGAPPDCFDSADTNDTGNIEITDAIIVFGWLFSGGAAPAAPSPLSPGYSREECAEDPTEDGIGCDRTAPSCN